MKSFVSYVKCSPSDALPNFRSLPEMREFLLSLQAEVGRLEKNLKYSLELYIKSFQKDRFHLNFSDLKNYFSVFKTLIEKQKIAINLGIRASQVDKEVLVNDVANLKQAAGELRQHIRKVLTSSLSALSHKYETLIKDEFPRQLFENVATKIQADSSQYFVLPNTSGGVIFTLKLSNIKLQSGGTYKDFYVSLISQAGKFIITTSLDIPQLHQTVYAPSSGIKFISMRFGIKAVLEKLDDEGIFVKVKKERPFLLEH